MTKKAYIIPGTEVQTLEIQQLLVNVSGGTDGITTNDPSNPGSSGDSSEPTDPSNDNRSRRTYNCWDDEDEELDY